LPVIVLAGEEEYEIWQRAKALKKELVDPQWESFNFARIDNPDLKEVIDAAATVPFGPGNRMVLFDQCALFTKKRGAKDDDASSGSASKSAKLVDDFAAALKSVPPNTYLVFSCIANFDSSLKTSKAAAELRESQICLVVAEREVDLLLQQRSEALQCLHRRRCVLLPR
jgi:DNA polymerase III delta subunit